MSSDINIELGDKPIGKNRGNLLQLSSKVIGKEND